MVRMSTGDRACHDGNLYDRKISETRRVRLGTRLAAGSHDLRRLAWKDLHQFRSVGRAQLRGIWRTPRTPADGEARVPISASTLWRASALFRSSNTWHSYADARTEAVSRLMGEHQSDAIKEVFEWAPRQD